MYPIVCLSFVLVGHEVDRVGLILNEPASPEIGDALLVTRRTNYSESVQVDSTFNNVSRFSLLAGDEDGVALQQGLLKEKILILLGLDALPPLAPEEIHRYHLVHT